MFFPVKYLLFSIIAKITKYNIINNNIWSTYYFIIIITIFHRSRLSSHNSTNNDFTNEIKFTLPTIYLNGKILGLHKAKT